MQYVKGIDGTIGDELYILKNTSACTGASATSSGAASSSTAKTTSTGTTYTGAAGRLEVASALGGIIAIAFAAYLL